VENGQCFQGPGWFSSRVGYYIFKTTIPAVWAQAYDFYEFDLKA